LPTEDPAACRKAVEFLDKRFNLGMDLRDLDKAVANQDEKIARVRFSYPQLDNYIRNLENNLSLSQEESEKLVKEIEEFLKKTD